MKLNWESFNTSHVTLYRVQEQSWNHFDSVSIHLMLLFIRAGNQAAETGRRVSIHLMLLFIGICTLCNCQRISFQYISCYSLSWFGGLIRNAVRSFNTSHVTLYRKMNYDKSNIPLSFNTSHVTLYLPAAMP